VVILIIVAVVTKKEREVVIKEEDEEEEDINIRIEITTKNKIEEKMIEPHKKTVNKH
jgi:hypothetical protein